MKRILFIVSALFILMAGSCTPETGALTTEIQFDQLSLPSEYDNSQDIEIYVLPGIFSSYQYQIDNDPWTTFLHTSNAIIRTDFLEGQHTVKIKGMVDNGDIQDNATAYTWTVDITPPVGTLVINGGDVSSITNVIELKHCITNAIEMRFSENHSSWTSWENISLSNQFTLTDVIGLKTIYAQYRDQAGNIQEITNMITYTGILGISFIRIYGNTASGGAGVIHWDRINSSGVKLETVSLNYDTAYYLISDDTVTNFSKINSGDYFVLAGTEGGDTCTKTIEFLNEYGDIIDTVILPSSLFTFSSDVVLNYSSSDKYVRFYFDGFSVSYSLRTY